MSSIPQKCPARHPSMSVLEYRKISIISPELIFVQKALLLGLFSGELIFGGAYYWKEFCVSKWVELDNKTASFNSPWAYIWEGLLSEGFLRLRFGGLFSGGLIFGGAYYRNFTVFDDHGRK